MALEATGLHIGLFRVDVLANVTGLERLQLIVFLLPDLVGGLRALAVLIAAVVTAVAIIPN